LQMKYKNTVQTCKKILLNISGMKNNMQWLMLDIKNKYKLFKERYNGSNRIYR
jgi:hypothetical protein